jgi:hypothetical protein
MSILPIIVQHERGALLLFCTGTCNPRNNFLWLKYLNSLMRIRDGKKFGSGIQNKHPGSATLHKQRRWRLFHCSSVRLSMLLFDRYLPADNSVFVGFQNRRESVPYCKILLGTARKTFDRAALFLHKVSAPIVKSPYFPITVQLVHPNGRGSTPRVCHQHPLHRGVCSYCETSLVSYTLPVQLVHPDGGGYRLPAFPS